DRAVELPGDRRRPPRHLRRRAPAAGARPRPPPRALRRRGDRPLLGDLDRLDRTAVRGPGEHPPESGEDDPPRPLAGRDRRPLRRRRADRPQDLSRRPRPRPGGDRRARRHGRHRRHAPPRRDRPRPGAAGHPLAARQRPRPRPAGAGAAGRAGARDRSALEECYPLGVRPETEQREGEMADLERLLIAPSRTFALAIPLLPEPTRLEVTLSYLLFRVADTFEDAASWPRSLRIEALARFDERRATPGREEIEEFSCRWAEEVPCEQLGYQE